MFVVPFFCVCSSRVWEFANKQLLILLWMQLFFFSKDKMNFFFFPFFLRISFFYIWSNVVHAKLSTNNIRCLQFSTSPTENFFFFSILLFLLYANDKNVWMMYYVRKVLCVTIVDSKAQYRCIQAQTTTTTELFIKDETVMRIK